MCSVTTGKPRSIGTARELLVQVAAELKNLALCRYSRTRLLIIFTALHTIDMYKVYIYILYFFFKIKFLPLNMEGFINVTVYIINETIHSLLAKLSP